MKTDKKRIDLHLDKDIYDKVLQLSSLRITAEKTHISVTRTISDLIEKEYDRRTKG